MSEKSAEQQARDLLEQCGVEDAQSFTSGDVIALANFIVDAEDAKQKLAAIRHDCVTYTPSPDVVEGILAIIDGQAR